MLRDINGKDIFRKDKFIFIFNMSCFFMFIDYRDFFIVFWVMCKDIFIV